ncbi:MAG: hypothetical protein Q8Q14_02400 [Gemmatimonadales bacterium]|nr:hypothetical protein [Gemmatimonadales bacterium]
MLQRILTALALAALMLAAACGDRTPVSPPTAGDSGLAAVTPSAQPAVPPERLARFVARALANPAFRAYVKAQLDASPYREHKLHFQTFLGANGGRAVRQIAAENGATESAVTDDAARAIALEIYLPVPEHRAAWIGDDRVLVATALTDKEAPVAFDTRGRRQVLDPDVPPATPVIALVPVETDFGPGPQRQMCYEDCGSGSGDGGTTTTPPPGLYLTKSHLVQTFEGWLKGSPEIEVHILGQKGQTDSLISYQCAGEHAGGPYAFNQDGKDWSGQVLLFSKQQIEAYNTAHPGQSVRVFFVEDDDTACSIRTDPDRFQRLIFSVDSAYNRFTGGNDSSTVVRKYFGYAKVAYNVFQRLASWIKSNDELIGNAVEDRIVGAFYPGYNWFIKGEYTITYGWINLVMY